MRFMLSLAIIGWALPGTPAFAQSWTSEQQAVWKVEDEMWKRDTARDLGWIDTYMHADATSWGIDQPLPRNRDSVRRWDKYEYDNSTVLEYELFPLAITVAGDVAVVHYRYRIASEDRDKQRQTVTGRYSDVLVKDQGRWLLITVVGGDDPGSGK